MGQCSKSAPQGVQKVFGLEEMKCRLQLGEPLSPVVQSPAHGEVNRGLKAIEILGRLLNQPSRLVERFAMG